MSDPDPLAEARATIARLNRRAQQAEAIADRCVASREQGAKGRSLGRALANYAAARLAEVAREALEEWADSLPYVDNYFAEKYGYAETMARLRARLDALTGEDERATLPPMSSPTLDAFAAAFYQSMIHNPDPEKAPRWEALTPEQQAERREQAKGALVYIGAPYEASPGDPPPVQPAP